MGTVGINLAGHRATCDQNTTHCVLGQKKHIGKMATEPRPTTLTMINTKERKLCLLWDPDPWSIFTLQDLLSTSVAHW